MSRELLESVPNQYIKEYFKQATIWAALHFELCLCTFESVFDFSHHLMSFISRFFRKGWPNEGWGQGEAHGRVGVGHAHPPTLFPTLSSLQTLHKGFLRALEI